MYLRGLLALRSLRTCIQMYPGNIGMANGMLTMLYLKMKKWYTLCVWDREMDNWCMLSCKFELDHYFHAVNRKALKESD